MNENLTAVQSALKVLQEKYDKVLKFIEKMQLKEKLEEFLKPVIQKHKSKVNTRRYFMKIIKLLIQTAKTHQHLKLLYIFQILFLTVLNNRR